MTQINFSMPPPKEDGDLEQEIWTVSNLVADYLDLV